MDSLIVLTRPEPHERHWKLVRYGMVKKASTMELSGVCCWFQCLVDKHAGKIFPFANGIGARLIAIPC